MSVHSIPTTGVLAPADPSHSDAVRARRRRAGRRLGRLALSGYSVLVLIFLAGPLAVVVPMSFSAGDRLSFPPEGLSLRWYKALVTDVQWQEALRSSLVVGTLASSLALVLGAAAAYALVRSRFLGRALITANLLAPLIVPAVVLAVALYLWYSQLHLLGTWVGLIMAHMVLVVPYAVMVLTVAIQAVDRRLEQSAASLGASWFTMFRTVTLPLCLPSIVAAWVFAFVMSFDEVVVTSFVGGRITTVPKLMFEELTTSIDPTVTALSSLLIVFAVAITFGGLVFLRLLRRMSGVRVDTPLTGTGITVRTLGEGDGP